MKKDKVKELRNSKTRDAKDAIYQKKEAFGFYDGQQWNGVFYDDLLESGGRIPRYFDAASATDYRTKNAKLTVNKLEPYIGLLASKMFGAKCELGISFTPKTRLTKDKNIANENERFCLDTYKALKMAKLLTKEVLSFLVGGNAVLFTPWNPAKNSLELSGIPLENTAFRFDGNSDEIVAGMHWYTVSEDEANRMNPDGEFSGRVEFCEYWDHDEWIRTLGGEVYEKGPNIIAKKHPEFAIPYTLLACDANPGKQYGKSVVYNILGLQQEYNMRMSDLSNMLRNNVYPTIIAEATGLPATKFDQGNFAYNEIDKDGKIYALDKKLVTEDLKKFINMLEYEIQQGIGLNEAVLGQGQAVPISGVALALKFETLTARVERWRNPWSWFFEEFNKKIITLYRDFANAEVGQNDYFVNSMMYPKPLPQDRSAEIQDAQLLIASGLESRRSLADKLGIDMADQEFEAWLAEETMIAEAGGQSIAGEEITVKKLPKMQQQKKMEEKLINPKKGNYDEKKITGS
jgi:hypothetical protein